MDISKWKSFYSFEFPTRRISRKSVRAVRSFLDEKGLGRVGVLLTCNDLNWRNQLFISQVSYQRFVLAEDGLGAYLSYRRRLLGWLYAEVYLRLFYSDVTFHYGKMNHSAADLHVSLSEGAFPWRPDSNKRLIFDEFVRYCEQLSLRLVGDWKCLSTASALLITQPLSDHGHWRFEDEVLAYSKMLKVLGQSEQLVVVKKHPAESHASFKEKIGFLESRHKSLQFKSIDSEVPVEVVCSELRSGSKVLSVISTGALNVSLARPDLEVFCDSAWANKLRNRWPVNFL
ncbi:hypothetical protein GM160_10495 [Guyparkeria halophila]|uniref:Uncharacterized protein n=1 Tax=Guyparkeria halophila TaxID=47960 RepID=A0A6I6D740_9GAMM|nr:hypothetical protein GM160_10495 [Guyparkeria halophila]